MDPTPQQLAARLNPTPTQTYTPVNGISTDTNQEYLFLNGPNGTSSLHISDILGPGEAAAANQQAGGAMGAINAARDMLKSKYGIDIGALTSVNKADLDQSLMRSGHVGPNGMPSYAPNNGITDFVNQNPASLQTTTINNTPNALPTSAEMAKMQSDPNYIQAPAPGAIGDTSHSLNSTLPGGKATNLYDYYASQGKALPAVAERAGLYASTGLGTAADYRGTATQNEALLSALQLKDHSNTSMGTTPAADTKTAANATPAGTALASALSGSDASTTIANYKTYLASKLGTAEADLSKSTADVNSFFGTRKTAEQILQEEMDRRGITGQQTLLKELDTQITNQTKLLKDLPDNIRTTLQDVGVSQAQLDRLTVSESKKPTVLLTDLLTKRGALATDINTAVTWAGKFADTRVADQAAKLAALEWQVTQKKDEYKNLADDAQQIIMKSIDERKGIMDTALTAAKNGASAAVVDTILGSKSQEDAIRAAGKTLVTPKTTSATTLISKDVADAGTALEVGIPGKGYNGRGADGFVDPNLYVQLYNAALTNYGDKGAVAFLEKYPPGKNINPSNIGASNFPQPIANALQAQQKKTGVTIDAAAINAALGGN